MLRSITRSKAVSHPDGQPQKVLSRRVLSNKARSNPLPLEEETDLGADAEAGDGVPSEEHTAPAQDDDAVDGAYELPDDDGEEDGIDLDEDVEILEQSGPGQFLIRRNQELLDAMSALRGEVEAMRRVVESGKDSAADRIVRAIDRADIAASERGRGYRRLLALLALVNVGLLGLLIHALWPLSFLPVDAF